MRISKGAKEREDTRYIAKQVRNQKTKVLKECVVLDPDCLKAKRKERNITI